LIVFDIWPSIVTLTLNWHMGNMGSAHPLVEVNIWAKFEENPSIGIGVIERTRKWRRTDRRTDGPTDATKRIHYSPPPHILWWGYNKQIKKWTYELYVNYHSFYWNWYENYPTKKLSPLVLIKHVHFFKNILFSHFFFLLWTFKMCVIHVSFGTFFEDSNQTARATWW
jgi:hypothetical protein